ncbi:MAG: DUF4276 family protein [Desulfovibrionaceae bacterium]|nr:DUF4276 family protein [Desulfovibrionaceae bacterium]
MIRLHIITEGPTEKSFANNVLKPYLANFSVFVDSRCILTSKDKRTSKKYSGGLPSYAKAKNDIMAWLKEDAHTECRFTTMFDLYALPNNFPGYKEAKEVVPYERVRILEERMAQSINDRRFIPYIQLHEFEALILAAPQNLALEYLDREAAISKLVAMVGDKNPEEVNDDPKNAPSKRILREIPEYRKTTAGVSVVAKTGLPTLRTKCRHFNDWLTRLEQLAGVSHE